MAKRKLRTPFVLSKDGLLFIRSDAVVHPLVALCDGLPFALFEKDKNAYLEIDVAIDWTTKEIPYAATPKRRKELEVNLEVLKRAKREVPQTEEASSE